MPSTRPLSRDTHPRVEKIQLGIYRNLPAWRKLELVEGANRSTRVLATAGLRARHPEASKTEIRRLLMDLLLGSEAALRAFGPLTTSNGSADGNP